MPLNFPTTSLESDPPSVETDWISAPGSSHLTAFKYIDRRASPLQVPSEIWVKFSASGSKPATTYKYSFSDHDSGEVNFQSLAGADQPGKVIWEFRRAGVPCVGPM